MPSTFATVAAFRNSGSSSTNPDFDVVARAAVQIKNAIDATIKLGGSNYVC